MPTTTPGLPRLRRLGFALAALVLLAPAAAIANGPFGPWMTLPGNSVPAGTGHGFIQIPHNAALNPAGDVTFEMWVRLQLPFVGPFAPESCRSLLGKDFNDTYWIGVCHNTLRSWLRGELHDGGTVIDNVWTHIAVTSDGTTRRHFVNGVQVGSFAEAPPLALGTDPLRIGSDIEWEFSPAGDIDEVRIWSFAMTAADVQDAMKNPVGADLPGLIAAWSLDCTSAASAGGFDGSVHGAAACEQPAPPAGAWITVPDLADYRFKARISGSTIGSEVGDCVPETVCIAGALPTRTELFIRVIGPRPNGFMHAQVIKFTVSRVEVWIEQLSTGEINYYELESVPGDTSVLPGLVDKNAFLP